MNEATVRLYDILIQLGILENSKNYKRIELILDIDEVPIIKTQEVVLSSDFSKFNKELLFKAKTIEIDANTKA